MHSVVLSAGVRKLLQHSSFLLMPFKQMLVSSFFYSFSDFNDHLRAYLCVWICSSFKFRADCQKQIPLREFVCYRSLGSGDTAFPCLWRWKLGTVRSRAFLPPYWDRCDCYCSCWQVWAMARLNMDSRDAAGEVHACTHMHIPTSVSGCKNQHRQRTLLSWHPHKYL